MAGAHVFFSVNVSVFLTRTLPTICCSSTLIRYPFESISKHNPSIAKETHQTGCKIPRLQTPPNQPIQWPKKTTHPKASPPTTPKQHPAPKHQPPSPKTPPKNPNPQHQSATPKNSAPAKPPTNKTPPTTRLRLPKNSSLHRSRRRNSNPAHRPTTAAANRADGAVAAEANRLPSRAIRNRLHAAIFRSLRLRVVGAIGIGRVEAVGGRSRRRRRHRP